MKLQPYEHEHCNSCLQIFDSNTPRFFAATERASFHAFLDYPNCHYFVLNHEEKVMGCGGYFVKPEQQLARLVWGMIHKHFHGLGLGRFLLLARLREIGKQQGVPLVYVDTSQWSAPFFTKQGFQILGVRQNGFAPGLDRVEIVKKLTVCG